MFDFMENFFSRSIDTVRTALYLLVMGLAIYAGITKKSFVAFITTAAIGGLAVWMISPAGFNIFPGLFTSSASDVTDAAKQCETSNGRIVGWLYDDAGKKLRADGNHYTKPGGTITYNATELKTTNNFTKPYHKPANRIGFHCHITTTKKPNP